MDKGIFVSVFDSKAETWGQPSVIDSKAAAIRAFDVLVNDRQLTMISAHPEDFTLFMIGEFDGPLIKGCDKLALANGIDLRKEVK